jgi:uncharacterized membrane protein (DUF4010 family)
MEPYEPFVSLAIALAAGLLIGVQREQTADIEALDEQSVLGGVRTYPMYALAGALSTLIGRQIGYWVILVTLAAITIPLMIAYADNVRCKKDRGVTSETAFIISFLLGVLCMSDKVIEPTSRRHLVVGAVAITVSALLSLKRPLHDLVEKISLGDFYATIKFLVLAVIILPLLPNENFGPFMVLNPFNIGLMIVLMAGIGLVGYVLIRAMGTERGLGLTGFVGGLVSSTAVTLAFSGRARREPGVIQACALAVVLASTVMLVRVLIEVAAVHPTLLESVILPLGAMMFAALAASLVLYLREKKKPSTVGDVKFHNPLELGLAIKFGLLFAVVLVVSKAAQVYLGNQGTYIAAVLAGLTDMDAITLSMARLSKDGSISDKVATAAIFIGAVSNTLVKGGMAIVLGGWEFGRIVMAVFVTALLAGAAGLLALFYWV